MAMNGEYKYYSTKYHVSLLSIAAVTGLAAYGKMTGDVATVLMAVNVGYHTANAWVSGKTIANGR